MLRATLGFLGKSTGTFGTKNKGRPIRNSLELRRGDDKLRASCGHGKPVHPDGCSMVIIEAVRALLPGGESQRR